MRSFSFNGVSDRALATVKRFPLVLFCSVIAVSGLFWLIDHQSTDRHFVLMIHCVMGAYLCMTSAIALSIFNQRYNVRKSTGLIFKVFLVAIAVYYVWAQPESITTISLFRFFLLAIAAHLGVAFGPFLVNDESLGFWQFNKSLFLRMLLGLLYSVILFAGLSIAVFSLNVLFDVEVNHLVYLRIFILIFGFFNTLFFLSSVPHNIPLLDHLTDYPKGLRVFTQFVLIPFVALYLIILYSYEAKILVTMVWPRGWVSYLVMGFSILGILGVLLVWPLRKDDQYTWIKTYSRWFFMAIFPLILLLAFGIGRRVIDYGVTEDRYIIILLSIWLLITSFYFLFSEKKSIKVIPIGLFLAALFSGFGPWNAFQISKLSQYDRLRQSLKSNGLLISGTVAPTSRSISQKELANISSMVNYMLNVHGSESIQHLFKQNLDSLFKAKAVTTGFKAGEVMKLMGLEYASYQTPMLEDGKTAESFTFSTQQDPFIKTSGASYSMQFSIYTHPQSRVFEQRIQLDSSVISWNYKSGNRAISFEVNDSLVFQLDMLPFIRQAVHRYGYAKSEIEQDEFRIPIEQNGFSALIQVRALTGEYVESSANMNISSLDAVMLVMKIPK